jgi:hypothetical protein
MILCEPLNKTKKFSASFPRSPRLSSCDGGLRAGEGRRGGRRLFALIGLGLLSLPLFLAGCTQRLTVNSTSSSGSGSLEVSPGALTFGDVAIGQAASAAVSVVNQGSAAVQISSISVIGQSFSVSGAANLPVTVAAGATYNLSVNFSPSATGAASGQLTIASNAQDSLLITVGLSGTGMAIEAPAPALSALNCSSSDFTGPATASCGVTVSAAAGSGGVTVALASNDSAVTVPPAGFNFLSSNTI